MQRIPPMPPNVTCRLVTKPSERARSMGSQPHCLKNYIPIVKVFLTELQQEAQRATFRAPANNVPPFSGIGQGGHFCLLIGPKNTKLAEDVEILLPVKFR